MKKDNDKLNKDGKASYKQEITQMERRFLKMNQQLEENDD